jgi:hypothetical protein
VFAKFAVFGNAKEAGHVDCQRAATIFTHGNIVATAVRRKGSAVLLDNDPG